MGLTPEIEFATSCCAWPLTPKRAQRVRKLAGAHLNSNLFQRVLDLHGISGLVQAAVVSAKADLPQPMAPALAERAQSQGRISLILAMEAVRVQRKLQSADVAAIFLKGASLAVRLYGDLGLRFGHDIDVL